MNNNLHVIRFAVELFFNDAEEEAEELIPLAKVWGYAEHTVPNFSDRQFKQHFRLSPTVFLDILRKLQAVPEGPQLRPGGNPEVNLEKQIMIALWYLANIESFRGVADRFGVSSSTAWHCLYRICRKLLVVHQMHKIISMHSQEGQNAIIDRFYRKTGFPGIVGAVDGSHIPIIAPKDNHVAYINRKKYHSVLLQGICDDKKLFVDCYAGEAGSIHDTCLLRRSHIGQRLDNLAFSQNGHLLGDAAYPLKTKLLVPYKNNGHLTNIQRNYNTKLSKSRVEHAFAYLKGRFRRLKLLEAVRMDLIPLIIISACILHNIAHGAEDFLHDLNLNAEMEEERLMNPEIEMYQELPNNPLAIGKRNNIANNLFVHRQ